MAMDGAICLSGGIESRGEKVEKHLFWVILTCVVGVLALVHLGLWFLIQKCELRIGAVSGTCAPLYAYVRPHIKGWLAVPLAWFGLLGLVMRRTELFWTGSRARFCTALYLATVATVVCVAVIDGGLERVAAPFTRLDLEYSGAVTLVKHPLLFLRDYPRLAPDLPMHCQNHPPGAVLFLWAISLPFGHSVSAMAWGVVLVGAALPLLVYAGLTGVVEDNWARRGALLLLACPSFLLFCATSMDAVFAVLLAGGIVCVIRASLCERRDRLLWVFLGGLAFGTALLMTYTVAVALLWVVLYLCLVERGNWRDWATLAIGVALPTLLVTLVGYRPVQVFLECVEAHHRIMRGTAHDDPARWVGLAVTNLSAWVIGCGVALTAAVVFLLWAFRQHDVRLLRVTALTVLISAILPVYTAEVERIWLFLCVPLVIGTVLAGCGALPPANADRRVEVATLVRSVPDGSDRSPVGNLLVICLFTSRSALRTVWRPAVLK